MWQAEGGVVKSIYILSIRISSWVGWAMSVYLFKCLSICLLFFLSVCPSVLQDDLADLSCCNFICKLRITAYGPNIYIAVYNINLTFKIPIRSDNKQTSNSSHFTPHKDLYWARINILYWLSQSYCILLGSSPKCCKLIWLVQLMKCTASVTCRYLKDVLASSPWPNLECLSMSFHERELLTCHGQHAALCTLHSSLWTAHSSSWTLHSLSRLLACSTSLKCPPDMEAIYFAAELL